MAPGRRAAVAAAVAVLVGTGLARRHLADDAAAARALAEASRRLPGMLPASAGSWSGAEVAVDTRGLGSAGIAALAARRYADAATGEAVTAVLICGRPGPIAAHGPEACYPGAGFAPASAARRVAVPGLGVELWSAAFRGGPPAEPRDLVVSWAWADRDGWSAPDNPRLRFAPAPVLFKLYLLSEAAPGAPPGSERPALGLAAALLPGLDAAPRPGR